jgi:hypothetical protein
MLRFAQHDSGQEKNSRALQDSTACQRSPEQNRAWRGQPAPILWGLGPSRLVGKMTMPRCPASPDNQFLLARILMVFGFASSFFGRVRVSTPSLYSAVAFSESTELGNANERVKDP